MKIVPGFHLWVEHMCLHTYVLKLKRFILMFLKNAHEKKTKKRRTKISMPLEMDRESGCDAVRQAATGPSGNLRACHFNKRASYLSSSPINQPAMLGGREPPKKGSWVWIFNKVRLSPQQPVLHERAQHCLPLPSNWAKTSSFFFNVGLFCAFLFKQQNKNMVIKAIKYKEQSFRQLGKRFTRKWKLVRHMVWKQRKLRAAWVWSAHEPSAA